MNKKLPYVSHEEAQLQEFKESPERALDYLNACIQVAFEENDPELVLTALATVAKAYGMARVAKDSELKRESLHRMLSKRGNPEWKSIFKIFRALHVRPTLELESTRVPRSSSRTASIVSDRMYGGMKTRKSYYYKGLEGRTRDGSGEIRVKRSDTFTGTLRNKYGKKITQGYRTDSKLSSVLKRERVDSLGQLRKKSK